LYGAAQAQTIDLRIVASDGASLWSAQTLMSEGNANIRAATVDVPAAALPIGRHWLEVYETPGATPLRAPLLITISDQWMVANFDDVLRFLQIIAYPAEIDSLRTGTGSDRRASWERFWARRDPLPATPLNEFREQFFERVKIATDEFSEGGRVGWETDRGQVFIVLGPPDHTMERVAGRNTNAEVNVIEWLYEDAPGGRLVLQFFDRTGFGRFELTEASESAFRGAASRIRPRT
jgi:GWxTD domain-containing protein